MMTKIKKAKTGPRKYGLEWNRVLHDNMDRAIAYLRRKGLVVLRVPHPTTMLVERPAAMSWSQFKAILRSLLQPGRGSVKVSSVTTGRLFFCSNKGNRPGKFERFDNWI